MYIKHGKLHIVPLFQYPTRKNGTILRNLNRESEKCDNNW